MAPFRAITVFAMVDNKHQVIVGAEAFGEPTEYNILMPMVDLTRENFNAINKDKNIFETTKLTADSGFHTNDNMKSLAEEQIEMPISQTGISAKEIPALTKQVDIKKERPRSVEGLINLKSSFCLLTSPLILT